MTGLRRPRATCERAGRRRRAVVVPALFLASAVTWCAAAVADEAVPGVTDVDALTMTVAGVEVGSRASDLADLDLEFSYRPGMTQDDYPDFIRLRSEVLEWLARAPAATGTATPYAAAGHAAARTLGAYPDIARAVVGLHLYPRIGAPHRDRVLAIAERVGPDGAVALRWALTVATTRLALAHQGPQVVDLDTTFRFGPDTPASALPALDTLHAAVTTALSGYPDPTHYWETMMKAVQHSWLARFGSAASVDTALDVYPTADVPYFHTIRTRTTRAYPKASAAP